MSFLEKIKKVYVIEAKILTPKEMAERRREKNESVLRSSKLKRDGGYRPAAKEEKKDRPSFLRSVKSPQDAKKFQKELDEQAKESKKKAKPKKQSGGRMKPLTAPKKEYKGNNFTISKGSEIGKELAKEIAEAFKPYHIYVDFGDEYVNLARQDGIHAEFYGPQGEDYCLLTGTYTMDDGEEKDLDFSLPNDLEEFVSDVAEILMVRRAS